MGELLDRLIKLNEDDYVPMHMPGSKRNNSLYYMPDPLSIDITEIDDFDNLHHPDGIIMKLMEKTASLFGADRTLLSVNGSSAGLVAAICAATNKGDSVLVARNVHRAVMNGIYLNELKAKYIYPELCSGSAGIYGKITAEGIEEGFVEAKESIKAVIITSPTYEGIVSDIKAIAEVVHKHGAVLIVDEAHGAHFNFHESFPKSAVTLGADLVIQSIHKTLPAMTQTALLHINGDRVDIDKVKFMWSLMHTTSPSYVLMASIDGCMTVLEKSGEELFDKHVRELKVLRERIGELRYIKLLESDDISKLVLLVRDGRRFHDELRTKYRIQLEMASFNYVIAMTSIGDKEEYYDRFIEALCEMDREEYLLEGDSLIGNDSYLCAPEAGLSMYEALNRKGSYVEAKEAVGKISAAAICVYPPGINVINPGEIIRQSDIDYINKAIKAGLEVIGLGEGNCIKLCI